MTPSPVEKLVLKTTSPKPKKSQKELKDEVRKEKALIK